MVSLKTNKIEKFKDILIVVLVFNAILLLYFLWGSDTLESFILNDDSQQYEDIGSERVISPDQIILCRGNDDYTLAYHRKEEIWSKYILDTFRTFAQGENIIVEEISEEKYKAVMSYPSIIATFEYNIPFAGFCERYNIRQIQGFDNISNITYIGFSKGSPESAFICDGNKKKYYRLVGSKELPIFGQVDTLVAEQGYTTYYTLESLLGEEIHNETLVPLELPAALVPIAYKKDTEIKQKENIEAMAQEFFGETFDFVRKIEESNGKTIYMYGYGQKVLIINPIEGSIEYKEESRYNLPESKSMFESLDIALSFISSHGGFETLAGQQVTPYMKSITPIDDKKNGYRFVFSLMVGKNRLFYEENKPIIIEVTDGQVSYFRREFLNFDVASAEKSSGKESISAINMLALNYEHIKSILKKDAHGDTEELEKATFEEIANKTKSIYIGYLKPKFEMNDDGENIQIDEGVLLPVWAVEIENIIFYFDLYEGTPKGYSSK